MGSGHPNIFQWSGHLILKKNSCLVIYVLNVLTNINILHLILLWFNSNFKDTKYIDPPIKTFFWPFGKTYCEIWRIFSARVLEKDKDFNNILKDWDVENLNIKFCKHLLRAGERSTNIAIISDLGSYPMFCSIIQRILLYRHILENSLESSLLYREYQCKFILFILLVYKRKLFLEKMTV